MAVVDVTPTFVSLKVTSSLTSSISEKRYPTSDSIGDLKASEPFSSKCTPTCCSTCSKNKFVYARLGVFNVCVCVHTCACEASLASQTTPFRPFRLNTWREGLVWETTHTVWINVPTPIRLQILTSPGIVHINCTVQKIVDIRSMFIVSLVRSAKSHALVVTFEIQP